jgi:SagB-type dehydrogenase family enzyme
MKKFSEIWISIFMLMSGLSGTAQERITLPPPAKEGGMGLLEALQKRHSSRFFSSEPLNMDQLSGLLWAANGINRSEVGKRTAPSSMNYQELDVFVCLPEGAYRYDPIAHGLEKVVSGDIRSLTGKQDFVGKAALNLVYVADYRKVPDGFSDRQWRASHTNAGFVAQNVYLFCAANNLAVVVRGWFEESEIASALKLDSAQCVILCQTVGWPEQSTGIHE